MTDNYNNPNMFGIHGLRNLQRDDAAARFATDEDARHWVIDKLGEAEPETIAFVAIGAIERWREYTRTASGRSAGDVLSDRCGGQTGVIGEIVNHAKVLDQLYPQYAERFHTVFAYEVAEPFGAWLFDQMFIEDYLDDHEILGKAHELLEAGCQ